MKLFTLFVIFFIVAKAFAFVPSRRFKNKIQLAKLNYLINNDIDDDYNFIILKTTVMSIIIGEMIMMPLLMSYKELINMISNSNNIDSTAMLTSNFF